MAATPLSRSCPICISSMHLLDAAGQLLRVLGPQAAKNRATLALYCSTSDLRSVS